MAQESGFFNARLVGGEYDRVYLAEQFAAYFASFIGNGVFGNSMQQLEVIVANPPSMHVTVLPGQGWINGWWYRNTDNHILAISLADGILSRIDAVVLRWDSSARSIYLKVLEGTPSQNPVAPTISRNADYYDLQLCTISIPAGSIKVTQAQITDTRLNNSVCGLVTGVVDQIDTSSLFSQFIAAYQEWKENQQADYEEWTDEHKEEFEEFTTQFESDVQDWFDEIKGQISEDAAVRIQLEINDITAAINNQKEIGYLGGGSNILPFSKIIPQQRTKIDENANIIATESDTLNQMRLSISSYMNDTKISAFDEDVNITSNGRREISFTYSSNYNRIQFKHHGSTKDISFYLDVSFLEPNQIYVLSYDIINYTQNVGPFEWGKIQITKGSTFDIPYVAYSKSNALLTKELELLYDSVPVGKQLSPGTDVNTLLENGFYLLYANASNPFVNVPEQNGYLLSHNYISSSGEKWCTHKFFGYNGGIYERRFWGSWSTWTELAKVNNVVPNTLSWINDDANNYTKVAYYYCLAPIANTPEPYGYLHVIPSITPSLHIKQIFYGVGNSNMYTRDKINGNWTDWVKLANVNDAVMDADFYDSDAQGGNGLSDANNAPYGISHTQSGAANMPTWNRATLLTNSFCNGYYKSQYAFSDRGGIYSRNYDSGYHRWSAWGIVPTVFKNENTWEPEQTINAGQTFKQVIYSNVSQSIGDIQGVGLIAVYGSSNVTDLEISLFVYDNKLYLRAKNPTSSSITLGSVEFFTMT